MIKFLVFPKWQNAALNQRIKWFKMQQIRGKTVVNKRGKIHCKKCVFLLYDDEWGAKMLLVEWGNNPLMGPKKEALETDKKNKNTQSGHMTKSESTRTKMASSFLVLLIFCSGF